MIQPQNRPETLWYSATVTNPLPTKNEHFTAEGPDSFGNGESRWKCTDFTAESLDLFVGNGGKHIADENDGFPAESLEYFVGNGEKAHCQQQKLSSF